jgi:hypothetical protein
MVNSQVRFGRIVSPNVWLGNLSANTDFAAVRAMLTRFGPLVSSKTYPKQGQVLAEFQSESIAQIVEESLKGILVGWCRLLVRDLLCKFYLVPLLNMFPDEYDQRQSGSSDDGDAR